MHTRLSTSLISRVSIRSSSLVSSSLSVQLGGRSLAARTSLRPSPRLSLHRCFSSSSHLPSLFNPSLHSTHPINFHSTLYHRHLPVRSFHASSLTAALPEHRMLPMPALSPTMEKGNIAAWKVNVGSRIKAGTVMADIETDKATIAFESQEDGYIAAILKPTGSTDIPVNTPVAVVVDEEKDVAAFKDYKPDTAAATAVDAPSSSSSSSSSSASAPTPQPAQPTPASAPSTSNLPEHRIIPMPALSPTMEKGNIATWKVKVGDEVKAGTVMADIETDKATVAFESQEEGFIAAILKPAGSTDIVVNTPVAILVEDKAFVDAFKNVKDAPSASSTATSPAPAAPSSSSGPVPSSSAPVSATTPDGRVIASPAARRISFEQQLNLSQFVGSGPGGRILAVDIEEQKSKLAATPASQPAATQAVQPAAQATKPAAPATATRAQAAPLSPPPSAALGDFVDTPLTQIRKVIAQRLTQSKQSIPHFYVSVEVKMDKLLKLRAELNNLSDIPTKLSVNDFVVKAAAMALRAVPAANSSFLEQQGVIRRYNYVDISVAVATDSGLITPIVKDADIRGLAAIAADTKLLATKAREGKLQPSEYQGGTFTISNLGMFGVKHFTAIINPPQSCILAVGASDSKVVPVITKAADGSTSTTFTTEQVMTVTLSCDHRVVDGAVGAQWLQAFKKYVEQPTTMLL